jgi:hypothetical protein
MISIGQLAERLPYIPSERLKFATGRNEDFIWNSPETYTHVGCIVISDEERAAINEVAMRECNVRGYVSITDLPLGDIAERNWKLSVAAVHNAVYRLCLSNEFDKRGKIVMRRGEVFDAMTVMKRFTLPSRISTQKNRGNCLVRRFILPDRSNMTTERKILINRPKKPLFLRPETKIRMPE